MDVGRKGTASEAFLQLKNATVGRFDEGLGIIGQVGVYGRGQAVLEYCKLGNLLLLTEDEGTIEARDLKVEGELRLQKNGGAISLPPDIVAQGE